MIFYGFTIEQLNSTAGGLTYPAGVFFSETSRRGKSITGVLRVRDSRKEGARMSASGRRTPAASWEAHRDFMQALFACNPDGRIKTMMADYKGIESFNREFGATYYKQVGSHYRPATFGELSV